MSAAPIVKRRMTATARRATILAAALDAFASGGYGATGTTELAERAGVTRSVLYDHFPSKKALFLAVLSEQSSLFLGHIGASITGEGTAAERMRATTTAVFEFAERHPNAWRLLFVNATHGDDDVDAEWAKVTAARNHAVVLLLAKDLRYGIDPDSPRAVLIVEMLVGSLTGAVEWRRKHASVPRAEAVDAALILLWSGLSSLAADR